MNEDEKKEQSEGSNSDSETENSVEKEVKSEESTKAETQEAETAQGENEAPKETEDSAKESKDVSQETEKPHEEGAKSVEDVKKEEPQKPTEPKKEVKVSGKLAGIIKDIEVLTVLELADLVKALEDKFGVSASAPLAAVSAASAATSGGDEASDEGQTTFNVIIAESGTNKIGVIKAVRELVPTLGLKEAKDLVDSAPKQVLEGVGKDAANEAKQKLETAGAKVELQ